MTCSRCNARLRMRRGRASYDASGLRGVTLVGVLVGRCPSCGETEIAIPNIEGLHRAMARYLANRPARLAPDQIRFLRKSLGFSGADFAEHIGVTPETVSRWENGATAMGLTAERLLRWMVLTREPLSDYPLERLKEMGQASRSRFTLGMRLSNGHWQPLAA